MLIQKAQNILCYFVDYVWGQVDSWPSHVSTRFILERYSIDVFVVIGSIDIGINYGIGCTQQCRIFG